MQGFLTFIGIVTFKMSESDLSSASNSRLKSGAFDSQVHKQRPGNELRQAI